MEDGTHFPYAFVSHFLLPSFLHSSRIVNTQTRRFGDVQLDVLCDLRRKRAELSQNGAHRCQLDLGAKFVRADYLDCTDSHSTDWTV